MVAHREGGHVDSGGIADAWRTVHVRGTPTPVLAASSSSVAHVLPQLGSPAVWRARWLKALAEGDAEEYITWRLVSSLFHKCGQFKRIQHGQVDAADGVTPYDNSTAWASVKGKLLDNFNKHNSWAKAVLATKGFDLTKLPSDGIIGLFKSWDFDIHRHSQTQDIKSIPNDAYIRILDHNGESNWSAAAAICSWAPTVEGFLDSIHWQNFDIVSGTHNREAGVTAARVATPGFELSDLIGSAIASYARLVSLKMAKWITVRMLACVRLGTRVLGRSPISLLMEHIGDVARIPSVIQGM